MCFTTVFATFSKANLCYFCNFSKYFIFYSHYSLQHLP